MHVGALDVVEYSAYITTVFKQHLSPILSVLSVEGRLRKKTTCNTRHGPPCLYVFSSTDVRSPLRLLTPPVISFRVLGRLFRTSHTVIWSLPQRVNSCPSLVCLPALFREFGGARCVHNIVKYRQCREHALLIIQQLVLSPSGDDDMGTLLGLMHSAPSSELQLKTDILRVTTHEFTSQSK